MIDLSYRERHVLPRMTRAQWEWEAAYLRRHKLRIHGEYWGCDRFLWILRGGESQSIWLRSLDFNEVLQAALAYAYPKLPLPDVAADLEQYFDREYRPHFADVDLKG